MKVRGGRLRVKGENALNDKAALKIAGWMLSIQNKFATIMNKGFSKLSSAGRKLSVFFFCLIGAGLSIYYICEAIIGARDKTPLEKIGKFEIPKNYNDRETEAATELLIDEDTWNKVQSFKQYMDSLQRFNPSEYRYIMLTRPGLMDSINTLEQIYYSQKIK